jgi:hypothetical protein
VTLTKTQQAYLARWAPPETIKELAYLHEARGHEGKWIGLLGGIEHAAKTSDLDDKAYEDKFGKDAGDHIRAAKTAAKSGDTNAAYDHLKDAGDAISTKIREDGVGHRGRQLTDGKTITGDEAQKGMRHVSDVLHRLGAGDNDDAPAKKTTDPEVLKLGDLIGLGVLTPTQAAYIAKWNPDQPRDHRGMWTRLGGGAAVEEVASDMSGHGRSSEAYDHMRDLSDDNMRSRAPIAAGLAEEAAERFSAGDTDRARHLLTDARTMASIGAPDRVKDIDAALSHYLGRQQAHPANRAGAPSAADFAGLTQIQGGSAGQSDADAFAASLWSTALQSQVLPQKMTTPTAAAYLNKWNPDQPRNHRGMWSRLAAALDLGGATEAVVSPTPATHAHSAGLPAEVATRHQPATPAELLAQAEKNDLDARQRDSGVWGGHTYAEHTAALSRLTPTQHAAYRTANLRGVNPGVALTQAQATKGYNPDEARVQDGNPNAGEFTTGNPGGTDDKKNGKGKGGKGGKGKGKGGKNAQKGKLIDQANEDSKNAHALLAQAKGLRAQRKALQTTSASSAGKTGSAAGASSSTSSQSATASQSSGGTSSTTSSTTSSSSANAKQIASLTSQIKSLVAQANQLEAQASNLRSQAAKL